MRDSHSRKLFHAMQRCNVETWLQSCDFEGSAKEMEELSDFDEEGILADMASIRLESSKLIAAFMKKRSTFQIIVAFYNRIINTKGVRHIIEVFWKFYHEYIKKETSFLNGLFLLLVFTVVFVGISKLNQK